MKDIYFNILKKIEDSGFKAYIVGGFVRDKLLNIRTDDVDICTNALPKDLLNIFESSVKIIEEYGAIKLKLGDNVIDITTFREEYDYKNNKPTKVTYTNSLEKDLERRDFTMNTLCLDKNSNLIDILGAKKDIRQKLIKVVGNTKNKFDEDATRILRSLRFMTIYKFKLSKEIIEYIENNGEKLETINYFKRKEELDKIFKCNNVKSFLNFIKTYNLEKYLGIKSNYFVETGTIIGVWAQLEVSENYQFTKYELDQIKKVKKIVKNKIIDELTLYENGLYISTIASDILGISKRKINKMYTNLPIKGIIDINITSEEICNILNIKPSKKLGDILKILEKEIISNNLKNEKEDLIKRVSIIGR